MRISDWSSDVCSSDLSTDARAIDVVAEITNLRSTCSEGDQLYTEATFTVNARRSDAGAARQVTLPYYSAVVRGGNAVVAKRVGQVVLDFPAGQYRATTTAKAGSYVNQIGRASGRERVCQ